MEPTQTLELEIVPPSALESLERAQIDMQISTAKRYPRSLSIVKKRMLDLATLDQETAESCFYRLNRQGKMIEGPSIRLAEIAGSSFGNLRYGARVIANDGKTITAQGYCHDLETNVMSQVEVQRRITGRDGQTYSADMQVVTGNAACAIAARNAIFKVVPFAFVKPIFSAAKQAAVGDIKTLAERRTQMLKKFAALGVNEKRICETLKRGGAEEIGLEDLETLIGLYNGIKENEQTVEEAFPMPIAKPIIGTGAPANTEKPKRGRKKADEPDPNAVEMQKRLASAGKTVTDLVKVAIKKKWIDEPGPDKPVSEITLADIGEDKLATFLADDLWTAVAGELDELGDDLL